MKLPPLAADAFLAWAWRTGPRVKGTTPLTVDSLWFELGTDFTERQLRRGIVRLAARTRRNARLGRDPWEGLF